MVKRLTLIRHAKSSWEDHDISDFDRPLAPRGIKATPKIAQYLLSENLYPDLVLCSPARRTKETLARLQRVLTTAVTVNYDRSIYSAGMGEGILNLLKTTEPAEDHIWVIGHNPAIQELSLGLVNWGEDQAQTRARILRKFSTAGVCSMTFETDSWSQIGFSKGKITHFMTPKMLDK